jgi:hypothetical protein
VVRGSNTHSGDMALQSGPMEAPTKVNSRMTSALVLESLLPVMDIAMKASTKMENLRAEG